jgi:DeoR/GlpR family transcriptional regulator of sugar metabolism
VLLSEIGGIMLSRHQRQARILELLGCNGYTSVVDLSQLFQVSEMTIRRDLSDLHELRLIFRHHGGASLAPERGDTEWPLQLREREHLVEKEKIGRAAARYVQDGEVLILDAGTTTLQVARNLTQNRLTVVSNFLPILCELSNRPNISLIATGGTLYADNQCFVGPFAVDTIRKVNANVAIMATSCLSLKKGLTNRNIGEAEVKRAMIESAERVVLVMDSSKMHFNTLSTVGPLEIVDVLVTDAGLSAEDKVAIEARGVEIVIANS